MSNAAGAGEISFNDSLDFLDPVTQAESQIVGSKTVRKIINGGAGIVPGSKQSFTLSGGGLCAFDTVRLRMLLKPDGVSDPNQRLDTSVRSIFREINVYNGKENSRLYRMDFANLQLIAESKVYPMEERNGAMVIHEGADRYEVISGINNTGNQRAVAMYGDTDGHYFEVSLAGILKLPKLLPLFNEHYLIFEVIFANVEESTTNGGVGASPAPASWTIPANYLELIFDLIITSDPFTETARETINSSMEGVPMKCLLGKHYGTRQIQSTESNFSSMISANFRSIQGILIIFRNPDILNSGYQDSLSKYYRPNLREIGIRVNNSHFPDTPLQISPNGQEAYDGMCQFSYLMTRHQAKGRNVRPHNITQFDGIIAEPDLDRDWFLFLPMGSGLFGEGYDNFVTPAELQITMAFYEAIGALTQVDYFLYHDATLRQLPNGGMVMEE